MSRDDDDPSAEEMKVFVWGGINGEEDQSGIDGLDDKSLQVLLKPAQCRPLRDFGEDEGEEQEQESLSFRDVSISAGYSHGAMTVDGRAYIAGCSANEWTGRENLESISQWRRLDLQPNTQVVSVSVGFKHTLALDRNGHVYSCGFGEDGALGHGNVEDVWALRRIETKFSDTVIIKSISAGGLHSMALADDGAVYVWGCGKDGRLGLSKGGQTQNSTGSTTALSELEPRRLKLPFPCAEMICAGHDSSCVVDACDKRPYLFGCAKGGVLGPSVDENIYWPEPSAFLKDNEISYVDIGGQIAIAKTADGRLLAWGAALSKLYNLKSRTLHVLRIPPDWGSVQTVSCGDSAAIGICRTPQGATKLWTFGLMHAAGMRAAFPTDCDPSNGFGYCCSVAAGVSYLYAVYRPTGISIDSSSEPRLGTSLSVDVSKSCDKSFFSDDTSSDLPTSTEVAKDTTQPPRLELERLANNGEEEKVFAPSLIRKQVDVHTHTDRHKRLSRDKSVIMGIRSKKDENSQGVAASSSNKVVIMLHHELGLRFCLSIYSETEVSLEEQQELQTKTTDTIRSSESASTLSYQGLHNVATIEKYRPQASADEIIDFVKVFLRENLYMTERKCLDFGEWTVYGISDIHTDISKNMDYFKRMVESRGKDALAPSAIVVAGDIATSVDVIRESLSILKTGFDQVFYIPGNHDLWSPGHDNVDSIEKLVALIEMCTEIEIGISPCKLGSGDSSVAILPLFSWYRDDFIRSPGQPLSCQEAYFDAACKWPSAVGDPDFPRNSHHPGIADFFLKLNDLAFEWLSEHDPVASVSFSHFLPLPELYWGTCNLQAVMGDLKLGRQVERIRSAVHVFGHSHLNTDRVVGKTRYLQNALGYPDSHCTKRISIQRIWPADSNDESCPS